MDCVYAEATEEMPDACGLHEMSVAQRRELFRDPQAFSGKCIKMLCHYGYLPLPKWEGRYKVILMLRDPSEIMESYEKLFGKPMCYEDFPDASDLQKKLSVPFSAELYGQIIRATIQDAAERGDINFLILDGRAIIENPPERFKQIADFWPIDAAKAAAIVDKAKVHCGNEVAAT